VTLTIELPDNLEAVLKAHASAQGVSAAGYARSVLERALISSSAVPPASQIPFKTGRGSFAQYGTAPSAEEIDGNRAEMFQRFAEDV
jgi:plasmid stability protein